MIKKPTYFAFSITERCQSHCITCNGWKTPREKINEELSAQDWKFILKELKEWVGNFDFIFSGGEPFIRDDIFEIADFAAEIGLIPKVITNGLGLKNKCEKLIKSGFRDITISLNSILNPDIHNKSRGRKDAHKITTDVIRKLVELNRKENAGKTLLLSTIIMPSNLEELVPLAQFTHENNMGINFQMMDSGDAFFNAYSIAYETHKMYEEMKEQTIQAIEKLKELKAQGYLIYNPESQLDGFKDLILNSPPPKVHVPRREYEPNRNVSRFNFFPDKISDKINQEFLKQKNNGNYMPEQTYLAQNGCQIGYRNFAVDPYGNVRICFNFPPVGSLKTDLPKNIWNSPEADEMRKKIMVCDKSCKLLNCNYSEEE